MHIRRATFLVIALPFLAAAVAAYIQWATVGLPPVPASVQHPGAGNPQGFPLWIGTTHYINLIFLILLIRSGMQILLDHPRLYWNVGCTPGTEWVRFTPVVMPTGTAKDDARYLSPLIGLPGGKHTLGMSRHWHFVSVLFWVGNRGLYSLAVCHWPVAQAGTGIVADRARRLGHLRALRHVPHACGTEHFLSLQRTPAVVVFRGAVHPGAAQHFDRTLDVTRVSEPVYLVSQVAG